MAQTVMAHLRTASSETGNASVGWQCTSTTLPSSAAWGIADASGRLDSKSDESITVIKRCYALCEQFKNSNLDAPTVMDVQIRGREQSIRSDRSSRLGDLFAAICRTISVPNHDKQCLHDPATDRKAQLVEDSPKSFEKNQTLIHDCSPTVE
jgi:hypothetical protein